MPWIGCGECLPPLSTGDADGSTANTLQLRERLLQHPRAAGDVAAGPDAGDQHVEAVREVLGDLARGRAHVHIDVRRVLELLRHPRSGVCAMSSFARAIDPFMPFSRGVSSNFAPNASISRRRSIDMLSGITSTSG